MAIAWGAVTFIVLFLAAPLAAQDGANGLAIGRQMLAQDNPGELWVGRGERLFYAKRGLKQASLEQCDLGRGPGRVDGAYAQLPRYFADTDRVQDLESRLLTCMIALQGFKREDIVQRRFGTLDTDSDMEALVSFLGSKSNGLKMAAPLHHAKEREVYKAGEYLFHRRSGPLDFSCATCHSDEGKRVRLQELPNMTDAKQVQMVVSTGWPAYRGTQATVRTMQHRLYDCNWQMRHADLGYASDMSVALTSYLHQLGKGGVIQLPGVRR
ncbi:MAG: sulfur oxidation c-type cytochrome SoxA [Pseudomonadota bacterium]